MLGFVVGASGATDVRSARGTTCSRNAVRMMANMPKVPYKAKGSDKYEFVDIYNRFYRERIVFINQDIDDETANQTMAVLLFLESEDDKAEVQMYFNCPGGTTTAGLAIYDCMRAMKYPITTLNLGFAAGIGAFLVGAGTPGKRLALPNSRFLVQAPSMDNMVRGQADTIAAEVKIVLRQREKIVNVLHNITGRDKDRIKKEVDRDFYLTAYEAREYGLIDRVLQPKKTSDIKPIYNDPLFTPVKSGPSF
eukprot:Plantae.Rhodophyta-Purpureofilum_apyrenoidigerum.ctg505.p1 GENE.Plantae.Rhodophyta-Purpureofilum_apyrenoidigerum.ctg505~~Plantae.Rhodophyta-Purpureofilum_apyrenoidigerum.ctg505.p1  ORF type:complete len:250 (+),score=48.82 Plantae.Rhodophyta-Purpureofilum_apyrenoidigerum.ctg505:139-888(+)